MKYLEDLNSSQKEAVLHPKGPCLVIAGAGSGKTRVLTYRIAHLIKQGIDPFSILALTFTNKAAKEMKNRIEGIVGTEARSLWMGTFHSIFARILRTEGYKIGYPPNFVIYDTQDSKNLIKAIVKEQNLDPKLYKENFVFNRISNAKNRLISPLEYKNNPILQEEDSSSLRPMIGEIYKIYSERCFKSQAMDFDDLLFNTNTLFSEHIDILNKYQQLFQHVLIDEFQDTNYCQYLITKRLASVSRNIFVVGDDAQSIYAFRGAEIRNILKFEDDFDDLKTIKLEQNYRSTKTIVNAANSVIEKNKSKISKEVWTDNEDGDLISVKKSFSDNEEGKIVSNLIFEEKNRNQLTNSNFAVLYRTNSQSRSIEEALRRIGLKYKVFGGVSFYQRKEVKDLIAYLRFSINQNDEQSFRRIINYPRRGIGQTSVDKIITISNKENISLWDVIQRSSELLNSRINNLLTPFKDLIISFSNFSKNNDAYTTASHIASNSGLLKELWDDRSIEGISRYENVQELLNSIKEFLNNKNWEHLLFSYHGIPKRHIKKSDITKSHCKMNNVCCDTKSKAHNFCYRHQCKKTTQAVAKFLKLKDGTYSTSFQSRLGPDPWLQPYTDKTINNFAKSGVKNMAVVTPAFVSDCLETLEEIGMEAVEDFEENGGEKLHVVPCINDREDWVELLSKWVTEWNEKVLEKI